MFALVLASSAAVPHEARDTLQCEGEAAPESDSLEARGERGVGLRVAERASACGGSGAARRGGASPRGELVPCSETVGVPIESRPSRPHHTSLSRRISTGVLPTRLPRSLGLPGGGGS